MRSQDLLIIVVGMALVGTVIYVLVTPEELAKTPIEASELAEQSQVDSNYGGDAGSTAQ